jgi:hypothetical protein
MIKPIKLSRVHLATAVHDPASDLIGLDSMRDIFTNQQYELVLASESLLIGVRGDPNRVTVVPWANARWATREAP